MKKRNIFKTVLFAGLVVFATGCEDLLQTEPQQSVSPEVATSTPEGIRAVYHRGYRAQMFEAYWGQRLVIAGDALADNAVSNPVNSGRYTGEPVNQLGSGVGGWNRYLGINDINTVIKHVPNVTAMPEAERIRIEAEMLFLRALAYHDLVKVYAYEPNKIVGGWDRGVILRLEPTETIDAADFKSRATVLEVYNQIEADLLRSISLFQQHNGTGPFFANRAAAHALLARVYLYWERWGDAIEQATAAIANTDRTVVGSAAVASMFTLGPAPNPESLFELRMTVSESLGVNVALSAALTPLSHYDLIPSQEFLATLAPEDARNAIYQSDLANFPNMPPARGGHRYVTKYQGYVGTHTDNIPLIRISEVYLTRAEAYAERGNAGDAALALADLNRIRTNRGLAALGAAPANLVAEILLERRRELAFEGHRWHDIKRKGLDLVKPAVTNTPTLFYNENIQFLARIPITEVALNPMLEQNPGY
ncbi:MAG: RagB/SusD family nutrient uptake outer membrane protein [Balneolaceae bacterium]|nr:MAG: RagB/SusD family nutrient uptake outer membrane protein [Balneolaceae bacterium]